MTDQEQITSTTTSTSTSTTSTTTTAAFTDRETHFRQLTHNLRNHLYVIGLSAAILRKKGPVPDDFDQLLTCIANEHRQAVQVLDEVLKLARG